MGRDPLRRSKSRVGLPNLSTKPKSPGSPRGERRKRVSSESLSTGSPLVPAGGQHAAATAAATADATAGYPGSGQQLEVDERGSDAARRGQPRRVRDGTAEGTAEEGVEGVLDPSPYEHSTVEGLGKKLMYNPTAATMALVHGALDTWSNDCICIEAQSSANCLVLVAEAILERHGLVEACHLDRGTLRAFLLETQGRYGSGQYHNSVHGADVMLSTHLFLTKFGVVGRLTKLQLLAALLGALVHDFNHPGTSNAHEVALPPPPPRRRRPAPRSSLRSTSPPNLSISQSRARQIKIHSRLAIVYSDQSVLEQHHLASAFAVLHTPGTDLLSGLTTEEFVMVRSLVIDLP